MSADGLLLARRLTDEVLSPMKRAFVGKDEIIDLLGIALVAGENLFLHGPPGTAKSALVRDLSARIDGKVFDYLLTRFTEPNELFGPFDIRKLREGELVTNTEGMLPEASLIFLDELLNANSAILNSLLMVLNERVFRRGRETRLLPLLMVVGASNRLPEDEALRALYDRFLLRVPCLNVPPEELADVLVAGWTLDVQAVPRDPAVSVEQLREVQALFARVELTDVRPAYLELIQRFRHAGISVSDRRAVKLQRLLAASAILSERLVANRTDLWVLRYIWDTEDQQEILTGLVQEAVGRAAPAETEKQHPRAQGSNTADPEHLARDLERLAERIGEETGESARSYLKDQLTLLAGRCPWVGNVQARKFLEQRIGALWERLRSTPQ